MASGLYPVTIQATDGINTATCDYILYVEGPLDFTPAAGSVLTAREGVAFEQKITATGGFSEEYTYEVSNLGDALPEGLSLTVNPDYTATISGTPAVGTVGSYDVYIYVNETFAGSPVDSYLHYTIQVDDKLVSVTPPSDPVYAGADFTFSVDAPAEVIGLKLVNETGRQVSIIKLELVPSASGLTWKLTTNVATPGDNRVFKIYTKDIQGNWSDSGETLNLSILSPAVEVKSATFGKRIVAPNESVEIVIVTSSSAKKVQLVNENGRTMGKSLVSKSKNADGDLVWVYTTAIGSKGLGRIFIASAAGSDGIYSDITARDYIHVL